MLMPEFAGRDLAAFTDPALWEAALRLLARMHIEHTGCGAEMSAWGCPDRGLGTLVAEIETLRRETIPRIERHGLGLTDAERAAVEGLVPRIVAGCARLARAGIPDTLIHGDFHAGNVRIIGGDAAAAPRPLIYDWTDAARAHPFFDLLTLLPFEDTDRMGRAPHAPPGRVSGALDSRGLRLSRRS
jgi:aminoglycoside/choline kinase family phosphotransferase